MQLCTGITSGSNSTFLLPFVDLMLSLGLMHHELAPQALRLNFALDSLRYIICVL
jgi:hypothetical protein